MINEKDQDQYRCSDLNFCAYLLAKYKMPIVTVSRKSSNGRVSFTFDPQGRDVDKIRLEFFNGGAQVSARGLCDELRLLKNMIFNLDLPVDEDGREK